MTTYHSNSKDKYILALDPGNKTTGYCLTDPNLIPIRFGKLENEEVMRECTDILSSLTFKPISVVIERVASYGMAVGQEVFQTCEWIGRYTQELQRYTEINYVFRKDEKLAICHSMKANDATIKQALVDRFALGVSNHGKGTKKEPGFFYGFKADVWSAFAVAVTFHDIERAEQHGQCRTRQQFEDVGY